MFPIDQSPKQIVSLNKTVSFVSETVVFKLRNK